MERGDEIMSDGTGSLDDDYSDEIFPEDLRDFSVIERGHGYEFGDEFDIWY